MADITTLAQALGLDPKVLEAALASAGLEENAPTEEAIWHDAEQFMSMGFVVIGSGDTPTEGDFAHVPTKSGGTNRVQLIEQVDPSTYVGDRAKGKWAFTYRKLKRGE